jgi:2-oxoglutarate dehydrogenase E2 component (dihydrolipoamide succinyltransferase)
VSIDINAKADGVIGKFFANIGDTVEVGKDFYEIDTDAKGGSAPTPVAAKKEEPAKAAPAPAAKKEEPAKAAHAHVHKEATPQKAPSASASPVASSVAKKAPIEITGTRTEIRVPMSRMRQKISQRLKESQNTAAMLTTFNEIDMTNIMELRTRHQEAFTKKYGFKLGFMSAFVKASVAALQEQPVVNAVIDGGDMVYRDFIDISVAVSTPTGLVVPALRNCQEMGFADVEREIFNLGKKGREGKITLEDMAGGTFTITNGGVFGSMMGTPIINPPQSAILGMHATKVRPVVHNGKIEARPVMYVALTYDHRIIDGREAVLFLRKIKESVEEPESLLL